MTLALALAGCARVEPVSQAEIEAAAPSQRPSQAQLSRLSTYPRFGDSDPHEWEGRGPRSYAIDGSDVSR